MPPPTAVHPCTGADETDQIVVKVDLPPLQRVVEVVDANLPFVDATQVDVDLNRRVGRNFDADELLDDRKAETAAGGKVGAMLEGKEVANGRRDAEVTAVVRRVGTDVRRIRTKSWLGLSWSRGRIWIKRMRIERTCRGRLDRVGKLGGHR